MVYKNMARAQRERDDRNEALSKIVKELGVLEKKCQQWSEARVHGAVKEIVGRWGKYIDVHVGRKRTGKRV
ncbi:transposase, partial [mine drainage metagenome]